MLVDISLSCDAEEKLRRCDVAVLRGCEAARLRVTMAPFPDEVDVFTGPHWRMKHLVGLYCDKVPGEVFTRRRGLDLGPVVSDSYSEGTT